ncbi:hypothetical protein DXG01_004357, partial [Tephrocybe rancida]
MQDGRRDAQRAWANRLAREACACAQEAQEIRKEAHAQARREAREAHAWKSLERRIQQKRIAELAELVWG